MLRGQTSIDRQT